jgi:predicted ATPase
MGRKRAYESDGYLFEIELLRDETWNETEYPYALPVLRGWDRLPMHEKVTFFVGENGAGKSTLVEAIAVAWGFNAEGGSKNFAFGTRPSHSPLHTKMRMTRTPRRCKDGYFLRAESYFNVATEIERLDEDPQGGPRVIDSHGGRSLHEMSHGQSFLALFENRFRGNGFYVLDEPEAALSPQRQLMFLARLHELVRAQSQFVIATHSPIILAYPHAQIYEVGPDGVSRASYDDLEHVRLTKRFLNRPETFLNAVLGDD